MEYTFYTQKFWATCMRLPWKTEGALIFFIALNMCFLSIRIFEQLALALKNRVAQKFFAVWNILFTFRIFEQLALALKNRGCPDIFHCIEHVFSINQDFWATSACPEKQSCSEIFCCMKYTFTFRIFEQLALALKNRGCTEFTVLYVYFLLFRIFEQLALALKNRVALEFSLYWNIFYYSGFLSNLRLPWNFSSPGGRPPPRLVRLCACAWLLVFAFNGLTWPAFLVLLLAYFASHWPFLRYWTCWFWTAGIA